jgi:hypothetical protein
MTTPASDTTAIQCPACGASAAGRFCANCGASLEPVKCAGCDAMLSPGARFCHQCGRPVNGEAAPSKKQGDVASSLPWIVAAIALLTVLALLAGRGFNSRRGSALDGSANALPQIGLDDRGAEGVRAPDISALSPEERADRLYNRVMILNTQGKSDSVQFFAPMAINAYEMLAPLDADRRYDLGRIGEVAGALPLASAQADSILAAQPNHLLGLILAARIATLAGDTTARRAFERRLLAAESSELKRNLPEYSRHADDITNALAEARRSR